MPEAPVTLSKLAFACYLFDAMAGYDESYNEFRDRMGNELDLRQLDNGRALLHWLNHWGCRHLATKYHGLAARTLAGWYDKFRDQLPPSDHRLISTSDTRLDAAADLFDGLCGLIVAKRKRNGATNVLSLGPTAAAKTLFALRPHVFVPWDVAMRDQLGHDGSGRSYAAYLRAVRHALSDLEKQCTPLNITLDELPARLGREASTAAQLIDEYHWITITRGVKPPDRGLLEDWIAWT